MTIILRESPPTNAATALSIDVKPLGDCRPELLSFDYWNWRGLYDRDETAVPLQHPDVVLAELEHLPRTGLEAWVISLRNGNDAVGMGALLPKVIHTRQLGGLPGGWSLKGYRLAGNQFALDPDHSPHHSELLRASLQQVQQSGGQFLRIDDLDRQSPLNTALEHNLPAGWTVYRHAGIQPRRRIHLPATPELYWQKFSSKTRQTFRRKLKKFGRTHLERIVEIADVPRFLQEAHEISKQTWQTRQFGLRVRNNAAELTQFTKLAELGLLRCYLWNVDDRPVAFTIGNQDHGCFHYEEVGYLPEFARFSPGQMMLIQMIDDLITFRPASVFDFGGGDADYKELFANETSESGTVWLFAPGLQGQLSAHYLQACRGMRQYGRKLIQKTGWTSRLRQWVRYGGARSTPKTDTSSPASGSNPPATDQDREE